MSLNRRSLALYAAPALPLALLGLPLTVMLPLFWAGPMGLPLANVGATLTAVRLLDTVFDPLVGRVSDRLRIGFGRRKSVIAAALPIAALGVLGLFFPPRGAAAGWLFLFYGLTTWGWTMISLPYWSWGAELSRDYAERARITLWREAGTMLGILLSAAALLGPGGPAGGLHLLAGLAIGLGAPAWAAALALVPEAAPRGPPAAMGLGPALRMAGANRPFRRLLGAWAVNGLANGMTAALFLLVCAQALRAPMASGPLLLAYFIAAVAGVPLWGLMARRIGKHRAWAAALLWAAGAFAFVPLLAPHDVGRFMLISIATGAALGADFALPPAIQADVLDLDEWESGEARAGLFFAAWTMAQKAGNALAVGIAFPVLGLVGFRAEGPNGAAQIATLIALYCVIPILLKLLTAGLMWDFPLDAAAQARLRHAIARRAAVAP